MKKILLLFLIFLSSCCNIKLYIVTNDLKTDSINNINLDSISYEEYIYNNTSKEKLKIYFQEEILMIEGDIIGNNLIISNSSGNIIFKENINMYPFSITIPTTGIYYITLTDKYFNIIATDKVII